MEFIPLKKRAIGSAHIIPMEFIPLKKRAIGATPIIMKATKKIETKILKIYDKWLHSYLNGDVATYDSYLDDEFHFIGSATKEEFLNRKDTTQFFANTGDQFAGKTELRNETKTLEHFGELIFITHVFDGWFLHEKEWNFYSRFRFSSTLRKNKDGWRFIYQHFSIPDAKTNDGETIGYDKINEENLELREAIQRRTVELESKNRELEVEGALERIRAQAVAMKQSSDLLVIVVTMRTEFIKLGHEAHYFWHMMWLPETYEKAMTSGDGTKIGFVMELPRHIHGDIPLLAKWEKSKKPIVVYAMDTEAALAYVDKMVTLGDFQNIDPQAPTEDDIRHIGGLTFIMARTTHGEIGYSLPGVVKKPPKEDLDILEKFAGAFDLAHRRFLDLQKAEKQAREVEIELALEKVRSRTMGMQRSEELKEVILEVNKKLQDLGISMVQRATAIFTFEDGNKDYKQWVASPEYNSIISFLTPYIDHPIQNDIWNARQNGIEFYAKNYSAEEKNSLFNYLFNLPALKDMPEEEKIRALQFKYYDISIAFKRNAAILVVSHSGVPLSEAENTIVKRLAKVFEQTYTRFLDLQKAEAQARESGIELALERVRARTMAMQHSDELQEASFLLDEQVRGLGIKTWGCAFNIYGDKESTEWFGNEAGVLPTYTVPRTGIFKKYYDKGQKGETLWIEEFSGKACVAHYETMSALPVIGAVLLQLKKTNNGYPTYQIDHVVYFKYGYLLFITKEHVPEAHDIFKRFAKVFEQTYTRFLDLQKAEAQTREAQIEAALEKIRSSSLAMHKTDDLGDVVSVLFEQLQRLDVDMDFGSVSIFVFQEDSRDLTQWIQLPEEVVPISVPYFEHPILSDFFDAKEQNKDYFEKVYTVEEKNSWAEMGFEFTDYKNLPAAFKTSVMEAPGYAMSIALKKNSGICIPSFVGKLPPKENIDIMKRVSMVFEQAYIRFLDLKKAELQAQQATENLKIIKGARAKAEKALKELKSAQSQLIQSEKMASLGELTAGIAHEIQNPLNFVNNFSEVSKELLEEMLEEIENGDMEEVKAIMADVIQNLEKINHHGKRADGIVKGMLQHSRSSTGKKEPTDINALADEYLRLAYHGLRAKDKSFNAELVTDFDDSIGNISVIPQDLGRVILNLITNAFYAVNEKAKSDIEGYQPTVTVSSKRTPLLGGAGGGSQVVKIAISDNGNGIPKDIVDKIFQPFFTTKPTGQGTGLGLSMSYDIVTKGHGGELQVETKEGEKTKFIIILPA